MKHSHDELDASITLELKKIREAMNKGGEAPALLDTYATKIIATLLGQLQRNQASYNFARGRVDDLEEEKSELGNQLEKVTLQLYTVIENQTKGLQMSRDQLDIVLGNLKLVQKFNTIRQKVAAHQGNHPEELLAFLTHTSIAFPHLRAHIGILPEEKNHFGLRLQKIITSASPSSRDTPGFIHPLSRFITNYGESHFQVRHGFTNYSEPAAKKFLQFLKGKQKCFVITPEEIAKLVKDGYIPEYVRGNSCLAVKAEGFVVFFTAQPNHYTQESDGMEVTELIQDVFGKQIFQGAKRLHQKEDGFTLDPETGFYAADSEMDYFMKWVKKPELLLQIGNLTEKITPSQFTTITLRLDEKQFQGKHQRQGVLESQYTLMLAEFSKILHGFKRIAGLEFIQRDSRNQFTIITKLPADEAFLVIEKILGLFKETGLTQNSGGNNPRLELRSKAHITFPDLYAGIASSTLDSQSENFHKESMKMIMEAQDEAYKAEKRRLRISVAHF